MRAWVERLDLGRRTASSPELYVAEVDGVVVAWAELLAPEAGVCVLDHLWVDPPWIGQGVGTRLFRLAAERARELGAAALEIESEPNSLGFYTRLGARHVREQCVGPAASGARAERCVRSGFVAVAGRPNVGKSTLVNALCGAKVAIVSDKPQTTRRRIHGIYTTDEAQLVLTDLPGFQRPLDAMTERMQRSVDQAFEDVDAVLFVLDARERIGAGDRFIASRVFSLGVPVVVALNKVDRLKPAHIAQQMQTAAGLGEFHALHPVSAKTGDGVDELRGELLDLLAEGPAYFSPEQVTDLSLEARIAELVREKALALTKEEVPHALTAEVTELDERRVHVNLYVETESQKQILIGKGGRIVREIGTRARPEVEQLLGRKVYLELQVKAVPKWRRNETMLERLGI